MAGRNKIAEKKIQQASSAIIFKDENTLLNKLKPRAKKALLEFRCRIEDPIVGNYILGRFKTACDCCMSDHNHTKLQESGISLWGVPLLPSKGHEGTDIILMKFLRAKDYKVNEAL
ncbi:hypothetical protein GIB67_026862 [Kingdonia uniflora]|uniref:Uncharacterized protein n=1 Tax=Kingdonia uniflora TaxID=39325 RepID=A0A7J7M7S0_9MAGN|nr:hypothetical protein GIB67_026862 [Kingdonia uniflora]